MYFDQSNIECWKDLAREHGKQIQSLEEKLESKRRRDRLELAGRAMQALIPMTSRVVSIGDGFDFYACHETTAREAMKFTDALLAELDKETPDGEH